MDSPPDGPCEVILTGPDLDWMRAFVRQLVEDRLAAAGHVDTMHSTYRWAGRINEADEARAILHTRFERVEAIVQRTREEHPYEVACVAATAIVAGEPSYITWINDESTSPKAG